MNVNVASSSASSASAAVASASPGGSRGAIAIWLFSVCALIFLMVVVGGVTRLTESGLSIVDWKPISGVVPPLTDQAWQAEFAKYQQFPEYLKVNKGMDIHAFQQIFWWEYGHRLLGRLIGLVFALPFIYFLVRGRVARHLKPHLVMMFVLGGCQGLLGWYMVKSGLVDQPDVSHYRLTAHLGLALAIYSYILWVALGLVIAAKPAPIPSAALRRLSLLLLGLVCFQILLGGFVAGLNAGFAYNTWPLMGDGFAPDGMLSLQPLYANFLVNIITIQFAHRMVAYVIAVVAVMLWLQTRKSERRVVRVAGHFMLAAVSLQILLGILTLIYVVPVPLGAAHQGGAVVLLTAAIYATRRIWRS